VVYQETYDRAIYSDLHTSGPKRDFNWRLDCVERGYGAGFRRLGIGALFGLAPWQADAVALAAHLDHLFKRCWRAQISVSLPRIRPAAGEYQPQHTMTDRELAQLICALRITFPEVGIVLSTRERASLRDALVPIGQFEISDERSPAEIASVLRRRGFEPVWKDWDQALAAV